MPAATQTNMTIEDATEWCRINGDKVRILADRGYDPAKKVIAWYIIARDREKSADRRAYAQAAGNLIGWVNEVNVAMLSLDSRAELRAKYGIFEEDAVDLKGTPGLKL